jgi:hypothetical protein
MVPPVPILPAMAAATVAELLFLASVSDVENSWTLPSVTPLMTGALLPLAVPETVSSAVAGVVTGATLTAQPERLSSASSEHWVALLVALAMQSSGITATTLLAPSAMPSVEHAGTAPALVPVGVCTQAEYWFAKPVLLMMASARSVARVACLQVLLVPPAAVTAPVVITTGPPLSTTVTLAMLSATPLALPPTVTVP